MIQVCYTVISFIVGGDVQFAMGDRVYTNLPDHVYDEVLDRHEKNGETKSDIVAELAEQGLAAERGETGDSAEDRNGFYTTLGQSLFVAGPVVALLAAMGPGVGVMFFGLGLMLWGQMRYHAKNGAEGYGDAFKRTLGI